MKLSKILLFFLPVFLFSNCHKNEDPVVDPCLDVKETTADFGFFLERSIYTDKYYIEIRDTFYNDPAGTKLTFRAPPGMDEYNWTVGADPRVFHDSLFALAFYGLDGALNVSLTTKLYEPSSLCFPEDTGSVTVSKSIYMKRRNFYPEQWPINGAFRGADEDAPDSIYTVSFLNLELQILAGFPNGCHIVSPGTFSEGVGMIRLTTPREFHIYPPYDICWNPIGIARLDDDDNNILIIDYTMDSKTDPNKRVTKHFVGTRVE